MILAWRNSEIRHAFYTQLVPNRCQVAALVELYLVRDHAGTIPLVVRVLEVPAGLRLLNEAAHDVLLSVTSFQRIRPTLDYPPDLEVLDRIALVVFTRSLPSDRECSQRREANLKDVRCRES